MQYRLDLFRILHEIVFYGKGGYDFDTVYNLPIWLRNFIYSEISKAYKREAEIVEKAQEGNAQSLTSDRSIKRPQVNPADYSVKARK